MTEPHPAMWAAYLYIRPYHPYWLVYRQTRNPQFNAEDGLILDFKEGKSNGVGVAAETFREVLTNMNLPKPTVVALVPGHKRRSSNADTPLGLVVRDLEAKHPDLFQGRYDTLLRTSSIDKLAGGGDRSVDVHLASIKVSDPALVRDRTHILLDDVATTGNSITACRKLLLDAGAKRVGTIVLGKTT